MAERDPILVPADFRPILNELSPADFEKLKALQKVMLWAQEHEISCTGRPGQIDCPNPPFTIIVLNGSAFALPCIDCVDPVIKSVFRAGHASCRQSPFTDSTAENLKIFAAHRRKVNREAGKFVIPERSRLRR